MRWSMKRRNCLRSVCGRLLLVVTMVFASADAAAYDLDSVYAVLDAAVTNSDTYIYNKEKRLSDLSAAIKKCRNDSQRYDLTFRLYDELRSYDNAKAKEALRQCLALAQKLGSNERLAEVYSYMAFQCSVTGYYTESLNWLGQIDAQKLSPGSLPAYYFACTHVYGELASYCDDHALGQEYFKKSDLYRDKYFSVADTTSSFYRQRMASHLLSNKRLAQADSLCRAWEKSIEPGGRDYAVMAYFRSAVCQARSDMNGLCYWLAVSAISDCHNAVMDQTSLWSLARLVGDSGDLKRSQRYVEYSWMCTTKFGGHTRTWQVSPVITAINENYRKALSRTNRTLTVLLTMASVLAILFLVSLLFVYKRNHQLFFARDQLRTINGELENLNRQLRDSNRVKDEYIGRFLSLCSKYIDKLDAYRMKVNRRLKANQYKELQNMTSSNELRVEEAKELFANFDAVFLRLYPNFVEDFNALLRPEYHQTLGANNELTTDMRMAALIRLGVNDSANIAEFLRLSPNTIYNYRARLKSRCVGDRDTFEERIREIGL
jgi:hypothetical protein